jgi:hypothetical protein
LSVMLQHGHTGWSALAVLRWLSSVLISIFLLVEV